MMFDSATVLFQQVRGPNDRDVALSVAGSADAMDLLGRADSSLVRRRRAVELLRVVRPVPEAELTAAEMVLAGGMIASHIDEDSALPMLETAIARERRSATPRWSLIARAEAWAIMPTERQRGKAAAESVFLRASEALKREKNPGPETGATLGFLIQALLSSGHAAEAVEPARLLVNATKQRLGADHILVGQAQNLLAGAYTQLGRLDEARATFDSAITLSRGHAETDKMYLANMYSGRAVLEVKQHDTRAAYASISEVRRLLPALGAQRPVAEVDVELLAAAVDVENGRLVSARQHLVRAVDIARTALGPQATRTAAAEAKLKAFDAEHPSR